MKMLGFFTFLAIFLFSQVQRAVLVPFPEPVSQAKLLSSTLAVLSEDRTVIRLFALEAATTEDPPSRTLKLERQILDFFFIEGGSKILFFTERALFSWRTSGESAIELIEDNCEGVIPIMAEEPLNIRYFCLRERVELVELLVNAGKRSRSIEDEDVLKLITREKGGYLINEKTLSFPSSNLTLDLETLSVAPFDPEVPVARPGIAFKISGSSLEIPFFKLRIPLPLRFRSRPQSVQEIIPLSRSQFAVLLRDPEDTAVLVFEQTSREFWELFRSRSIDFIGYFPIESGGVIVKREGFLQVGNDERRSAMATPFTAKFERSQNIEKLVLFEPFALGLEGNLVRVWDLSAKRLRKLVVLPENARVRQAFVLRNKTLILVCPDSSEVFRVRSMFSEEEPQKIDFPSRVLSLIELPGSDDLVLLYPQALASQAFHYDFEGPVLGSAILGLSGGSRRVLLVSTRPNKIHGFLLTENQEIQVLNSLEIEGEIEVLSPGKGESLGSCYLSTSRAELYRLSVDSEGPRLSLRKVGDLPGRFEAAGYADNREYFVVSRKRREDSLATLIFLNGELQTEFTTPVLGIAQTSVFGNGSMLLHDGLRLGQVAKFYKCEEHTEEGSRDCYCSNGKKLFQGNCEYSEEKKSRKGGPGQDLSDAWPYLLIIGGTMGVFFVLIIYNIKSTEREIIKSIKRE